MSDQSKRLSVLEARSTEVHLKQLETETGNNPKITKQPVEQSKARDTKQYDTDHVREKDAPASSQKDSPVSSQKDRPASSQKDGPVSSQKDGPVSSQKDRPASSQKDGLVSSQTDNAVSVQRYGPNVGFRHSTAERRRILRGAAGPSAASGYGDIRGSSLGNHHISASVSSKPNKFLVYVGSLYVNTSCDDVRCHLNDIDVVDIDDVIRLNSRFSRKESSFCISFHSDLCMKRVFNPEMWPEGVTVRPFRPARTTSSGGKNHIRLQHRGNRPQNQGQRKFTPRYQAQQNNFKNHYIDRSNYSRKSYLNAEYDDKNWEEYDNARDWHYYD